MADFDDEVSTYFRTRFDPTPPPEASFVVTAVAGPDVGGRWMVDETGSARVLVGTSPACQVRLRDRQISRRHLILEVEDTRVRVLDQESTNGTWLGSIKVGEVWLTGGEQLRLGETQLRFDRGPKPAEPLGNETHLGSLIGASREMRRIYGYVRGLAQNMVPVLVEGDTGTGKELLAQTMHALGPRAEGPFIVVDCSAISGERVDLELAGREASAEGPMTPGILEQANRGTLLLDEIADLAPAAQARLVQALTRGSILRASGRDPVVLDGRIIATTGRDLDREVQTGRFSEELYHRLVVARIELPTLRKRRGDIPLLVGHFVRELGGDPGHLHARVVEAWEEQPWPGNVRELRNAVARYLAIGEVDSPAVGPSPMLDPSGDWLGTIVHARLPLAEARDKVLRIFERRYVDAMLEAHQGNVGNAANAAGVARRYFQVLKARR
jgi:DNA-binding NtrC family response regulator